MALFNKADFIKTHNVDTAEKVEFILRKGNNRGHFCMEAMAVAAGATNQPPLAKADMIQSYVLDTAEKVQDVLTVGAIRGHEFMTAVTIAGAGATAGIDTAGPDLVVGFTLSGIWLNGAALNVAITVVGGTDISTSIVNGLGYAIGPDEMAQLVADSLDTIGAGDIKCGAEGGTVSISALGSVTALTLTTVAVA